MVTALSTRSQSGFPVSIGVRKHTGGPAAFTYDVFVERARKAHGNKYAYSKVVYVNAQTSVTIICPIHGDFEQKAFSHLRGKGCKKCATDQRTFTTEEFIAKARAVHGDKYDYDKVDYRGSCEKVTITCPIHGDFEQLSSGHLAGYGCIACYHASMTSNTLDFIAKAKKIHGDKYDYSKTIYNNGSTKITLTCPKHGDFEKYPGDLLSGGGCFACCVAQRTSTAEEFIEKATVIHGTKYTYDKIIYVNNCTPVIISCPTHGAFTQTPADHIAGKNCRQCSNDKLREKYRHSKEQFIAKAKTIHGLLYGYDLVEYFNSHTPVTIVCKKHGSFSQRPIKHTHGSGCPICKASKGELAIREILDKQGIKYVQEYRIPQVANKFYYDFYLPDYNVLIEFHGKQHFEYTPFFHRNSEIDFLDQKNRDQNKRYLAKRFGYKLLWFTYKHLKHHKYTFEECVLSKLNPITGKI